LDIGFNESERLAFPATADIIVDEMEDKSPAHSTASAAPFALGGTLR
jgi:hypothetical protein